MRVAGVSAIAKKGIKTMLNSLNRLNSVPDIGEYFSKMPEKRRYLPAYKVALETTIDTMPKGFCQWCGKSLKGTRSRRFCPPVKIDYYPYKRYECGLAWFFFWKGTPAFKKAVMIRDKFTCLLCGAVCIAENKHGVKLPDLGKLEIDHIIPVAKGGSADLANLQTLCKGCNRSKGAKYEYIPQPSLF